MAQNGNNIMKSYEFSSKEDFSTFLEEQNGEFYEIIWRSIDNAYASGRTSAYVAEIYLDKEKTYIDMISEEHEWVGSLTLAMNYYSSIEEYEICSRIKKLIEGIQDKTKS